VPNVAFGQAGAPFPEDDSQLIDRIIRAYRRAIQTPLGNPDSMWLHGPLLERRRDVHEAIIAGDAGTVQALLRDPGSTDLLLGFEQLTSSFRSDRLPALDPQGFAFGQYLNLLSLCEAVGVRRVRHHDQPELPYPEIEDLLLRLDTLFRFRVAFPNPFPNELGVATERGISSYRAPHAIYQAWRIWQLVGRIKSPRVLEIGGGLGRTAYYAREFGVTDYTIIDIPTALVAQANFLGRVVGPYHVQLYGEEGAHAGCIKLLPPNEFLTTKGRYDLILNVDSLTEMARETAQAYCDAICRRSSAFLSINHEGLPFTVADLMPRGFDQRSPYWMRPGYVEELSRQSPSGNTNRIARPPEKLAWRRWARTMTQFVRGCPRRRRGNAA
jgi:hypothetical protein